MGRMKNLAIKEQERLALDSLHDAKYWEIKDAEYEFYLNSEQYFDDIEMQSNEDDFINDFVDDQKSDNNTQDNNYVVTRQDILDNIASAMPYNVEDVE